MANNKPKLGRMGGEVVNKAELCRLFGVEPATVDGWVRKGCPFVSKPKTSGRGGDGWKFNTADVARWRAAGAVDSADADSLDAVKKRKLEAEAKKAELDLAERQGELVAVATVEDRVGRMIRRFRDRILSLPSALAREVFASPDLPGVERLLRDRCNEALEELGHAG
jgi:phage terminase Nu1 subunit (DNA packaging protein)